MGGEEVVREVLAQLAGRRGATLVLFTPAPGGRLLDSSPIPIRRAVSLKSFQMITSYCIISTGKLSQNK